MSDQFPGPVTGPTRAVSDATVELLARIRTGDEAAANQLIARYIPELSRWASGRLPAWARQAINTDDLVQETLIQVFRKLDGFEYRGEGALFAYLRQSVLNRIRNQVRWADRRPKPAAIDSQVPETGTSPLEAAIGAEALDRYEAALARLTASEREAVIARIELGLTYVELAAALGKPSPDAARMAVARAMVRLSEELRDAGTGPSTARPGRLDR
jgi:RNA polymerase sigma factor (sigma-70 family)